jgi:hypothetical protein
LKIPFTHVLGTKMTLLAEWGKLYQVTSEVGYGVITDEAKLSRATRCAVMCIFHIWIWIFASSQCGQGDAAISRSRSSDLPDNKTPVNEEILN